MPHSPTVVGRLRERERERERERREGEGGKRETAVGKGGGGKPAAPECGECRWVSAEGEGTEGGGAAGLLRRVACTARTGKEEPGRGDGSRTRVCVCVCVQARRRGR